MSIARFGTKWDPEIPSDGLTKDSIHGAVDMVAVHRVFYGHDPGRELHSGESIELYEMILRLPDGFRDRWNDLSPVDRIAKVMGLSTKQFRNRVESYQKRQRIKAKESLAAVIDPS